MSILNLTPTEKFSTLDWLQKEISRWTYKPKYSMRIEPAADYSESGIVLLVTAMLPDSRDPLHPLVKIGSKTPIPIYVASQRDSETFAYWLNKVLDGMEVHERKEWLRRDGEMYDDPHSR